MVDSLRRNLVSSVVAIGALKFARGGEAPAPDSLHLIPPELRAPLQKILSLGPEQDFTAQNLAAMRSRRWEGMPGPAPSPSFESRSIPGAKGAPDVRIFLINPQSAGAAKPAVLHLHGGGFIAGRAEDAVPNMQAVARELDCVVVSVDYRLAPETPFPGSLEDNYAALQWLHGKAQELGVNPRRIALLGESAGGGHAAMLAIKARDLREIPLAAQVLIYPMLDDRTASTRTVPAHIGEYVWTRGSNRFGWSSLLNMPAGSARVPYGAVPARVPDLAGLPPTFIGVGAIDLFAEEDIDYARRLTQAGVQVELDLVPGGYHGFDLIAAQAPLSRRFTVTWLAALRRAFE